MGEPVATSIRNQRSFWIIIAQKKGWTTWTSCWLPTAARGGPHTCHQWYSLTFWTSQHTVPLSSGWHWIQNGTEGDSIGNASFLRNWEKNWWDLKSREDSVFPDPQPLQPSRGGFRRRMLVPHPPNPQNHHLQSLRLVCDAVAVYVWHTCLARERWW